MTPKLETCKDPEGSFPVTTIIDGPYCMLYIFIPYLILVVLLSNHFSHLSKVLVFRVDRKNNRSKVVYDVSYCAGWIWNSSFYLSTKN